MEKYKYIPHTADQYIEAYGKDLNELFENVALGLTNMMVKNIEPIKEWETSLEATSNEELLNKFLSELLIVRDAEGLFFSEFKVNIQGNKLNVKAKGDTFNPDKHEQDIEVKAITYHDLKIEKKDGIYVVKVLVDI